MSECGATVRSGRPLLSWILGAAALLTPGRSQAQAPFDSQRIALRTGVFCHALPDAGSQAVERCRVGDIIRATKSAQTPGHGTWYCDSWRVKGIAPTCWVPADVTAPHDWQHPEPAYAAVVEYTLKRTDKLSFEDYVEVQNLFEQPVRTQQSPAPPLLQRSALLQFRSLQLIDRAVSLVTFFSTADAPLQRAWISSHETVLDYAAPSANWYIPGRLYWAIYEQHKDAPWADELAWVASQHYPLGDECYADCHLEMISDGPQQYWTRLPHGASIEQALAAANRLAADALVTARDEAPTRERIESVRASLSDGTAPERTVLLQLLAQLDRFARPP